MFTLPEELIERIHDEALNPGELPGRALDKSLASALARVDNRLAYGLVEDAYDLAAAYAMAIARGHCFNDANKRTAFKAMEICLAANGIRLIWRGTEAADKIILLAQGRIDDLDLADWLRAHS